MNHRAFYGHALNLLIEEIHRIETYRNTVGGSYDMIRFFNRQGGASYSKRKIEPHVRKSDLITGPKGKLTFQPQVKSRRGKNYKERCIGECGESDTDQS